MPPSKFAPVRVNAAVRREEMLRDRQDGLTFREIALKHGISQRRTRNIIAEEFQRLTDSKQEIATDLVKKQLLRLDALLEAVWDDAEEGDVKSVAAALSVIDRQSRLLGLDAPAKVQGTLAYTDLTTEELHRQARLMGLLPPEPPASLPAPAMAGADCVLVDDAPRQPLDG